MQPIKRRYFRTTHSFNGYTEGQVVEFTNDFHMPTKENTDWEEVTVEKKPPAVTKWATIYWYGMKGSDSVFCSTIDYPSINKLGSVWVLFTEGEFADDVS